MSHGTMWDTDPVLRVDKQTRQVKTQGGLIIGAAGEHHSEVLTFAVPQYIEGHNVAECMDAWVDWRNAAGAEDSDALQIGAPSSGYVPATWTVPHQLVEKAGKVSFALHFADYGLGGILEFKWSTARCDAVVVESVNVTDHGDNLVHVQVDAGEINAAVYTAAREVLYG